MYSIRTILFAIGILAIAIPFVIAGRSFAPWAPTRMKDRERIREFCNMRPWQIFVELGSGTSRILFDLARHIDGHFVGVEMFYIVHFWAVVHRWFFPYRSRVRLILGNMHRYDCSKADIIYLYGLPDLMERELRAKLEREMKPWSCVVSYVFPMRAWTPTEVSQPNPKTDLPIYKYVR